MSTNLSNDPLDLTIDQANEALQAGRKLYEMAVHQRDQYRVLLAAAAREYGTDFTLSLPHTAIPGPDVEPMFEIESTDRTIEITLIDRG